ncbi:protein CREG2 isoform X2 [Chroicocephalus ridibundus]|uniref:protein CREG2 isoform X2 n=1 Tax=Chroicocephalus ridibundus TaxID=1192867 RepID=UPI002FDCB9BE
MSAGRRLAGRRWLPAWWWCLLWGGAGGYVVVSSVSWPLPEAGAAADELHSSSTEDTLPSLLEEAGGLWKQSYPASAYREDAALGSGPAGRRPGQGAAPSRMFSYRREGGGAVGRAGTARFLARYNTWGFVATRAAQGKIQGMPYGNCLLLSDGPVNNSTGIPFFYVTPKDNTVADLLKNPVASLTLPEADGNFCRAGKTAFRGDGEDLWILTRRMEGPLTSGEWRRRTAASLWEKEAGEEEEEKFPSTDACFLP